MISARNIKNFWIIYVSKKLWAKGKKIECVGKLFIDMSLAHKKFIIAWFPSAQLLRVRRGEFTIRKIDGINDSLIHMFWMILIEPLSDEKNYLLVLTKLTNWINLN